ncbi:hypothetical protein [Paenibacillus mucilaginosus]|uniref:Uncharacterized protein n=1 Tax=Paenibacillus mucilaginosus (strain KNP414) TaxID=1036673 RepID=F8FED4_PAEMK|nr:hypothetical protein [Paenibacillus mucilaginosus]AEI44533.1 hypothetical protein KNP414_06009 [Paenibacillus mucilaginosus KNP414]MCG7217473.1 hypothetical protein [Paenibacillus mucilaginosus]WDM30875.1 hypothetical protein KCX80_17685 [Paenibacillus mucilaginosus]
MWKIFAPILLVIIVVAAYLLYDKDDREWYSTEKVAIDHGLKIEGLQESDIVSIDKSFEETFVIFQKDMKIGVATISKNDKGFSWYRSTPYASYDTANQAFPYTYFGFDLQSEFGNKYKLFSGIIYNKNIKKLGLFYNNALLQEREIDTNITPIYYFLVKDENYVNTNMQVKEIK